MLQHGERLAQRQQVNSLDTALGYADSYLYKVNQPPAYRSERAWRHIEIMGPSTQSADCRTGRNPRSPVMRIPSI
jgi:hypothetical protein